MHDVLAKRVQRFRLMAEEIRTAADGMSYSESRRALTSIADNYELLADQLEQLATRDNGQAQPG